MHADTLKALKPFLAHKEECSLHLTEGEHSEYCPYVIETGSNILDYCPCGELECTCGLWKILGTKPRPWSFQQDAEALTRYLKERKEIASADRTTFYDCEQSEDKDEGLCNKPSTLLLSEDPGELRFSCGGHKLEDYQTIVARIGKDEKLSPA